MNTITLSQNAIVRLLLHSMFSRNPIRENAFRTAIAVYLHLILEVR